MTLESKDRDRLEKLLNMLGSPNDGEIGNAGRMIQKMAERYNVTPAVLCLGNPQAPRQAEQPRSNDYTKSEAEDIRDRYRDAFGENAFRGRGFHTGGNGGPRWDTGRSWSDREEQRQREEQAEERQRARAKRDADFHAAREEELRQEGMRRAREQAKKDARRRRHFPGTYFGLLARLKGLYDNQFDGLENWQLDFIEIVLDSCKADRMMTRTQVNMAKALLKHNEEAEPLV